MQIWCVSCQRKVIPVLTDGREIYPHRPDLQSLPFWKCVHCGNYVGCHHKTKDRTRPLGNIPTPELRTLRQAIHRLIDPLWKGPDRLSRNFVYGKLSEALGRNYHTAELRSVEEATRVLDAAKALTALNEAGRHREAASPGWATTQKSD
jgi:uncharacterized protein DUF3268